MSGLPKNVSSPPDVPAHVAAWSLAVILFLSCGLDLIFFTGYFASDDIGYLAGAWKIINGGRYDSSPALSEIRLTLVGWNTLIALLFGYHIQLIAGSYIFFHQLANGLTFLLARRMHGNIVAVPAAFCMATTPLAVTHASAVLPDLPMTSFLLLSLLLFLRVYDGDAERFGFRSGVLMFIAGACVGLAYTAKETALILPPFYAVFWLLRERGRPRRQVLTRGILMAAGFLAIFFLEWAALSGLIGRSYFRMGWTVGATQFGSVLRDYPYGYYPLERLTCIHERIGPWFSRTGFHYILAAVALIYPFVSGRKLAPWALAAWYFVYHVWGSTRLTEYLPPPLQARYFTPMLPFLFILYVFLVVRMFRAVSCRIQRPALRRAVTIVAALACFLYPLPSLRISDRQAGKIYRADIVHVAQDALDAARAAGDRPVVYSKTIDYHIATLFRTGRPRDIVSPSDCRDEQTRARLASTGFYYVELYPDEKLEPIRLTDGLDATLHPLLSSAPDDQYNGPPPQTCELGAVEIDGHSGVLRRLRLFNLPKRRSEALLHVCFPDYQPRPDPDVRSAYLYEWSPR